MEQIQKNPFLTHFCNELSCRRETLFASNQSATPTELVKLVSAAAEDIFINLSIDDLKNYGSNAAASRYKDLALQSLNSFITSNETIEKTTEIHADLAGATHVAERLLHPCRSNQPLFQSERIPFTLSIGLTKIRSGDSIDTIIERADSALYRAKNNGKDRMEMEV